MDHHAHGVRATLIDLGLSRMDAGDGDGGEIVHWTPFEDEVFMGEGAYSRLRSGPSSDANLCILKATINSTCIA
jgi:hypothetical protein